MGKNLHKLYYRDYFSGVDWNTISSKETKAQIADRNTALTNPNLLSVSVCSQEEKKTYTESFQVEVLYPGLVTGIGINHEATIEGEFKLGMHFDWTYGMPVIYGSSVKGVLRLYFKEFYEPVETQPSIEEAFDDIFNGGKKSIYDRDIFFDAVVVKADKQGRILRSDSITPHGDNPLKNPIPITFLKIAPGCQLEFRFKLVPTEIIKEGKSLMLTAQQKLDIFKGILTTVGIGAKTNVGYGQLK